MIPNIPAREAWQALRDRPDAVLCDVRTEPEWQHVGVPDLAGLGREPVFVSWQIAPAMQRNARFVEDLLAAGVTQGHAVFFICRSGARSMAAAEAARAAGFAEVYNVAEGFEGRPGMPGWRAQGLASRTPG